MLQLLRTIWANGFVRAYCVSQVKADNNGVEITKISCPFYPYVGMAAPPLLVTSVGLPMEVLCIDVQYLVACVGSC